MAHTVSNEMEELAPLLGKLGIYLKKEEYRMDSRPLLRLVCQKFFGDTSSVVDLMVKHVPNAKEATATKLEMVYSGNKKSNIYQKIKKCDPQESLVVNIVKLYHKPDCLSFDAFGRVISGTIHKNETVKVLGENYSLEDEEDMALKSIKNLWIYEGDR
jgi:116 kDa U5 small nuclear ribonucleoprotein component